LPPYLWILTLSLVAASYLQINPWTQLLSLFRICYKAKNIMTTETFKVFMYLIFIYRNIYLLKAIITIYIEKLKNLINIKKKRVIPFKYKKKTKKNYITQTWLGPTHSDSRDVLTFMEDAREMWQWILLLLLWWQLHQIIANAGRFLFNKDTTRTNSLRGL
jgi:hypothetical protein